jgi:anaerobic magnesium-protoporphyrin IX monomethyl ester cyclase
MLKSTVNKERKKVACVIPPFFRLVESKNNRLFPAMHYIAEILHLRGHEVTLVNGDYGDDTVDYADRLSITLNSWLLEERLKSGHESIDSVVAVLKELDPDIIFIGAGDILIPTVEIGNAHSCLVLARRIKNELDPDKVCVGYGHLLRYVNGEELNSLDVVITGEGEQYATKIVEEGLRGTLSDSWLESLDRLPILTGNHLHYQVKPEDWDYIMSMRGCPNRCTFCFQPCFRGVNIATMTPKRFVKEVRYRIEEFYTRGFYFADMVFIPGGGARTLEMLDRLIMVKEDYPDFCWWAEARVDTVTKRRIVEKMARSGCDHLKFGVEAMDQDMLNVIKKGISLNEVVDVFKLTADYGIKRTAYVLLGCPGFNDADYQEMWPRFRELKADNYVININVPYQGTELYEQIKDKLHSSGLYQNGEEGFTHTSLIMKEFWGISEKTLKMFFELEGVKDDSEFRRYKRKIVNRDHYLDRNEVVFAQFKAR